MIGLTYMLHLEKISNKELAEQLKVTPATVMQWEAKTRPIPHKRLAEIIELYPAYRADLLTANVGEQEKLLLQNCYIVTKLKELDTVNNPNAYLIRRSLSAKIKHNNFSLQKLQLMQLLDNLFETAYNYGEETKDATLREDIYSDLLLFQKISDKLCKN